MSLAGDELHRLATDRLQVIGARYTANCRALLDVLTAATGPLTIPQMVEHASALRTSSAYRIIATLERAGLVTKIVTSHEHARYEVSAELGTHHHHLVCDVCGRVDDVELPDTVEEELHRSLGRIARRAGYRQVDHRIDLVGTCPDCG